MKSTLILLAFAVLLAVCPAAFAQDDGQSVVPTEGPPRISYETVYQYSGTTLLSICYARSQDVTGLRARTFLSVSAATNANPVVLTSTAHGFPLPSTTGNSALPRVVISGGTGNWTGINGTFIATPIDANTLSIPVDSTAFGALAGTVRFYTTAPRTGLAEWAVQLFGYDTNSSLVWKGWLNATSATSSKCTDATSTTTVKQ